MLPSPIENIKSSVFYIVQKDGLSGGTGSYVEHDGRKLILTNAHVCAVKDENDYVYVRNDEGESYKSHIINISGLYDLCAIEVAPKLAEKHKPIQLADKLERSKPIYAVGHPLLLPLVVSSGYALLDRVIDMENDVSPEDCGTEKKHVLKPTVSIFGEIALVCHDRLMSVATNVQVQPGSSGSPIVNSQGKLVGLVFGGYTRLQWMLAVPLSSVKFYISSIKVK